MDRGRPLLRASGTEVVDAIQSFTVREGRSGRASTGHRQVEKKGGKATGQQGNTMQHNATHVEKNTGAHAWYGSFEETILIQLRNSTNTK